MKFGRLLKQHAATNQYGQEFFRYGWLKHRMRCEAPSALRPPPEPDSEHDDDETFPDEEIHAGDTTKDIKTELKRVESVYSSLMRDLLSDLGRLRQPTPEARSAFLSRIRDLKQFCLLNYLAALKIAKKHDKVLGTNLRKGDMEILLAKSNSPIFNGLDDYEAWTMFYQTFPPSVLPPDLAKCQRCIRPHFDLLALDCGHEFCWACLSTEAAANATACPVCKQNQSLAPVRRALAVLLGEAPGLFDPSAVAEAADQAALFELGFSLDHGAGSGFDALLDPMLAARNPTQQRVPPYWLGPGSLFPLPAAGNSQSGGLPATLADAAAGPASSAQLFEAQKSADGDDSVCTMDTLHAHGAAGDGMDANAPVMDFTGSQLTAMASMMPEIDQILGVGDTVDAASAHASPPPSDVLSDSSSACHDGDTKVCSLFLTSADEHRCRFAVKNQTQPSHQSLRHVQSNGYIEYKARYSKKRGVHTGYGVFHIAFVPRNRAIYPFMKVPADPTTQHLEMPNPLLQQQDLHPSVLDRIEVYVRMYQPFRGSFPVTVVKFGEDETYHALYVDDWQHAALLQTSQTGTPGLSVYQDRHGKFLKYTLQEPSSLEQLLDKDGIKFPCPVPSNPEKLNDIGAMRMQLTLKVYFQTTSGAHRGSVSGDEFNVWLRVRVVQTIAGEKKLFTDMLRPPTEEFHFPPRPHIMPVSMTPQLVVKHVLGRSALRGRSSVDLLMALAEHVARHEKDGKDKSAVHIAAAGGNVSVARLLVEHEPSLVHRTQLPENNTPLHLAAQYGHFHVVMYLWEMGAQITDNTEIHTPVDLASIYGHHGVAKYLQTEVAQHELQGCTSLFRAAAVGHVSCLEHLLHKLKIQPDILNGEGVTALFLAAANRHSSCVATLLNAGADPLLRLRNGETVVHFAAARGYLQVLATLITKNKTAVVVKAKDNQTPLHRAGAVGKPLCAQLLLQSDADPTAVDWHQQTPAQAAGDLHAVTRFVIASFTASPTKSGASANKQALTDFKRVAGRGAGTIHHAASWDDVIHVRRLVANHRANACQVDPAGDTPIVIAARSGSVLVLDELIHWCRSHNQAAALVERGHDGMPPLHAAVAFGHVGCVICLLQCKNVVVDQLDLHGNTPLHLAAKQGDVFSTTFLLLAGADRSVTDASGRTPAHVASQARHSFVVEILKAAPEAFEHIQKVLTSSTRTNHARKRARQSDVADLVPSWPTLSDAVTLVWASINATRSCVFQARNA